ncbi:unnamed protein product [Pieris brassicae]|uniref:Uncharacterized protein n=1 Tax=Pieris brassicae TaxID=7116 RepID=A0A9P0TFV4_PIEBR|nr:unnamed protein product [Pieris brassicae]
MNEDQRAKEAKKRSERQRKSRNREIKKMKDIVSKLKTKLNTQRQKYKRVKKQLKKVIKSVEKTPTTRIEEMSKDLTKKKELMKKALFGEVIKTQLEENYIKLKTRHEKQKFKQVISGNVVDKYKLWRIKNKTVTYKKTGHNLTNTKLYKSKNRMQGLVQKFFEDDSNSRQAAAGYGKGAPDGVGATCKRTADQVIATGGDITNLNEFATVIRERCPGIKMEVIEECEIEQMKTINNDKSSEMVAFKGTLLVHQVTGTAYVPNNLTMKSLSCFCDTDECNHYKLGSINYHRELCAKNSTRLNFSTIFSDSEDDIPLSTYVKYNDDRSKLDSTRSAPGTSGSYYQSHYSRGDYVLVKYLTKKTEYHYAAVCSSVDDEDGK